MSAWLWHRLGVALMPRWLYAGPYWWRSLNSWWLAKWGSLFLYTKPWRPWRMEDE